MSIIDKVCGKLGLMDEESPVADEPKPVAGEVKQRAPEEVDFRHRKPMSAGNVVNLHTVNNNSNAAKQIKVMVVEPLSFDDAQNVADHLKNKKPVVVNFENTDQEIAKRIIDFISGTTYALAGNIQKVGNNIFLCAPSNVDVSYSAHEDSAEKVVMPWLKK